MLRLLVLLTLACGLHQLPVMYGKKPKTWDDWSKRRVSKPPVHRAAPVQATNETASQELREAMVREQRLQFEALRDGNKMRQNEILSKHLY